MKVTVEKELETMADLRLAIDSLEKKAKKQEAAIKSRGEALVQGASPSRVMDEALDSFNMNYLVIHALPVVLRYREYLNTKAMGEKFTELKASVKKKHIPYIAGATAALGGFGFVFFKKNRRKKAGEPTPEVPQTYVQPEEGQLEK